MPKVSIITLCPERYEHYLPECAASIEAQTYRDFQWVVVYIGPQLNVARVADIVSAVKPDAPAFGSETAIDWLVHPIDPDPGISTARNGGLALASGEYITMFDADDKLRPTFLEKLVAKAGPKTLVCPGLQEFENGHGCGWPTWGFSVEAFIAANRIFACTMYPRDLVQEIGWYDEALNELGIEDYEVWIRAVKAGYKVEIVPEILFDYRVHGDSHTARHKHLDKEMFE